MPSPTPIPSAFTRGPFLREAFIDAGLSPKLLLGSRFRRIFPAVWVHRDHELTATDLRTAARLCIGGRGVLSHLSRLQDLGLDLGSASPVHFTVGRDLHVDIDGILLHRTEVLPPCDDHGVTPAAAFIQICNTARLIDAIAIGDWLLYRRHASRAEIGELCSLHPWRPGARQARRAIPWLVDRAASLKESELRALILGCGLPEPEVNADVYHRGRRIAITDLLFRPWGVAVEYEGRQHAETTQQFQRDIVRYADLRDAGIDYVQVTQEMLAQPRALMMRLDAVLRKRGYQGPAPRFGARWTSLFRR